MNKNESKYFHTAALFDEALICLLEKRNFTTVTVKEICRKAGVNRSTFYLHYETIDDLLEETLEYITKKFENSFPERPHNFPESIPHTPAEDLKLLNKKYLTPYLTFVKENKSVFNATFANPAAMKSHQRYNNLKKYVLFPIMEKFDIAENERRYFTEFYINGIAAVIKEWLKNGCKEPVGDIEGIILRCVRQ